MKQCGLIPKLVFVALLLQLAMCQDPNCVRFGSYNNCIQCTYGKLPFNNQCRDAIPHCLEYSSAFACTFCEQGYTLNGQSMCDQKTDGYKALSQQEISLDSYLKKAQPTLETFAKEMPANSVIHRIYKSIEPTVISFRIIYRNPQGYTETDLHFDRSNDKITAENKPAFTKKDDETIVDLKTDTRAATEFTFIQASNPDLNFDGLLVAFYREVKGTRLYRLGFQTADKGIVQISATLIPTFSLSQVSFQSINLLKSDKFYQEGFDYFMRTASILQGSAAEKIGQIKISGWTYYVIMFRKVAQQYQAVFNFNSDGTIQFHQLNRITESAAQNSNQITVKSQTKTPTQTQAPNTSQSKSTGSSNFGAFLQIPADSKFSLVNQPNFQSNPDSKIILSYLSENRKAETDSSTLQMIWKAESNTYVIYKLLFIKGGIGYLYILAVDIFTKEVSLLQGRQLDSNAIQLLRSDSLAFGYNPDMLAFSSAGSQPTALNTKSGNPSSIPANSPGFDSQPTQTAFHSSKDNSFSFLPTNAQNSQNSQNSQQPQLNQGFQDNQNQPTPFSSVGSVSTSSSSSPQYLSYSQISKNDEAQKIITDLRSKFSWFIGSSSALYSVQQNSSNAKVKYSVVFSNGSKLMSFETSLSPEGTVEVLNFAQKDDLIEAPHEFTQDQISNSPIIQTINKSINERLSPGTSATLKNASLDYSTKGNIYTLNYLYRNGSTEKFTALMGPNGATDIQLIPPSVQPTSPTTQASQSKPATAVNKFEVLSAKELGTLATNQSLQTDYYFNIVQSVILIDNAQSLQNRTLQSVYKYQKGPNIYYSIVYSTPAGNRLFDAVISTGNLTVQIQKTLPAPGTANVLQQYQYQNDSKFKQLDKVLKTVYESRFGSGNISVRQVTRKVLEGVTEYKLAYNLGDGKSTLEFQIDTTPDGRFNIKSIVDGVIPETTSLSISNQNPSLSPNLIANLGLPSSANSTVPIGVPPTTPTNTLLPPSEISPSSNLQRTPATTTTSVISPATMAKDSQQVIEPLGQLSYSQFSKDPELQKINKYMTSFHKELSKGGNFVISKVFREKRADGNYYEITYRNFDQSGYLVEAFIANTGKISIYDVADFGGAIPDTTLILTPKPAQAPAQPTNQARVQPVEQTIVQPTNSISVTSEGTKPASTQISPNDSTNQASNRPANQNTDVIFPETISNNLINSPHSNNVTAELKIVPSNANNISPPSSSINPSPNQNQNSNPAAANRPTTTTTPSVSNSQPSSPSVSTSGPESQRPAVQNNSQNSGATAASNQIVLLQPLKSLSFVQTQSDSNFLLANNQIKLTKNVNDSVLSSVSREKYNIGWIYYVRYVKSQTQDQIVYKMAVYNSGQVQYLDERAYPAPSAPSTPTPTQAQTPTVTQTPTPTASRLPNTQANEGSKNSPTTSASIPTINKQNISIPPTNQQSASSPSSPSSSSFSLPPSSLPSSSSSSPQNPNSVSLAGSETESVFVSAEQASKLANFSQIDSNLRNQNQLSGYNVSLVSYFTNTKGTYYYTIFYKNAQEMSKVFKVNFSSPEGVQLNGWKMLPSNTFSAPPEVAKLMTSSETFMLIASFQISQPQITQYLLKIFQAYPISISKIQYILIGGDLYRLVSKDNFVYTVSKNSYDGTYSLTEITDIGLQQTSKIPIQFPSSQFPTFSTMTSLKVGDIKSIKGHYYIYGQSYLKYYQLSIELKGGDSYKVVFVQPNSADATLQQLMLLSLVIENGSRLIFPGSFSKGSASDINSLGLPIGTIDPESIRFQSEQKTPYILRSTFLSAIKQYPTRVEVIYDGISRKIFSLRFMDGRLSQFTPNITKVLYNQPISSLTKSPYIQSPFIRELLDVDIQIRQEWGLSRLAGVNLRFVMVGTIGSYTKFQIVYQSQSSRFFFSVLRIGVSKLIITSYRKISSESRYVYGNLEGVSPVDIAITSRSDSFQISQQTLFRDYQHFLRDPVVREIYTRSNNNTISYNLIYETSTGFFLAILDFDRSSKKTLIKSLVSVQSAGLQKKAADCQVFQAINSQKCATCKQDFEMQQGLCFKNIRFCRVMAADQCVACNQPYFLSSNSCSLLCQNDSCGI